MLANLVGQVGCVTGLAAVLIIGAAFGAGWLIDDLLGNESRIVTVVFIIGSFPITLFVMVRVSLTMVERAQKQVAALDQNQQQQKEDKENTQL